MSGEAAGIVLRQDVGLHGLTIRIRYATGLADRVAPVFRHLQVEGAAPDVTLDAVARDGGVELLRNGELLFRCSGDQLATVLKGQLLDEVLAGGAYALALHTATLTWNDRMLLVGGPPGAGKTTLTMALVDAGFGFAGDDLALLDADGRATGVPFAPAIKAGAWKLVARYRPDIARLPVFRRPDGRRVRYPVPPGSAPVAPRPVGWFVLLDRRPGAPARTSPVDPVAAIRGMLGEAYARGRRLTMAGFEGVARVADRAACRRLTYSDLDGAVGLLRRTCR